MANECLPRAQSTLSNVVSQMKRCLELYLMGGPRLPYNLNLNTVDYVTPKSDDELQENARINIEGESIRLNRELGTTEFGTTTRLLFETQGAIRFADGSYVQYGADIRDNYKIFEILRAPDGVQKIRTDNIRSCGVAEVPIGSHMMLLHGFDAQNLERLLEHGVYLLSEAGIPATQIDTIQLHTQNHWDYKHGLGQYCATLGISPEIAYVDQAVPTQKQVPGTVIV
ncbi:MAG: hypothetical protein ACREBW_03340 [Candidatus Micrarchaeaceae archaeon]